MVALTFHDIGLPPTQLKALARKAKRAGKTPAEYLRLLVEQDLLAGKSFDEILRPIRQDFQKSGVTETQLEAIVRRARRLPRMHEPGRSPKIRSPKKR
jgi:hypothetical protein